MEHNESNSLHNASACSDTLHVEKILATRWTCMLRIEWSSFKTRYNGASNWVELPLEANTTTAPQVSFKWEMATDDSALVPTLQVVILLQIPTPTTANHAQISQHPRGFQFRKRCRSCSWIIEQNIFFKCYRVPTARPRLATRNEFWRRASPGWRRPGLRCQRVHGASSRPHPAARQVLNNNSGRRSATCDSPDSSPCSTIAHIQTHVIVRPHPRILGIENMVKSTLHLRFKFRQCYFNILPIYKSLRTCIYSTSTNFQKVSNIQTKIHLEAFHITKTIERINS